MPIGNPGDCTINRKISGNIVFPHGTAPFRLELLLIELRDVSVADAPSSVLAAVSQKKVTVPADADLPFSFRAPEVDASRALSLRVHASLDGRPQVKAGDFVSTQSHPVPASGNKTGIILPLSKV